MAGAAKRRQNVELPGLEVVNLESLGASVIEVPCQSSNAGKDRERLNIEIGALALPSLDDQVDIVGWIVRWCAVCHFTIVDQES